MSGPLEDKSLKFALDIVKLYKELAYRQEYVLSKQVVRSGTSIGANIREAQAAQSKKDFVHKLSIALKECRETLYWLELLCKSDYITTDDYEKLNFEAIELNKLLMSIIITTKKRYGLKSS